MPMATFDALAYSETLQEGGIPMEQANAFARAQKKAMDEAINARDLATKKDLLELELRLTKSMEEMHKDNLKMMINALMVQTTMVLTAIGIGVALILWRFSG